jgi:hypothetical protein
MSPSLCSNRVADRCCGHRGPVQPKIYKCIIRHDTLSVPNSKKTKFQSIPSFLKGTCDKLRYNALGNNICRCMSVRVLGSDHVKKY